jgi:hypothetical protein
MLKIINSCTRRNSTLTISRLIPRLASDHDGEVLATVAAIRRILASNGRDLHDLARLVARTPRTASTIEDHGRDLDPLAMVQACLRSGLRYSDRALKFLTDIEHLGRRGCRLSQKTTGVAHRALRQDAEACMRPTWTWLSELN